MLLSQFLNCIIVITYSLQHLFVLSSFSALDCILTFLQAMGFSRIFLIVRSIRILLLSFTSSRLYSSEYCFRLYIYFKFSINFVIFSAYSLTHYDTMNDVRYFSYYIKSRQNHFPINIAD